MVFLFLLIMALFLPSCAGANLRESGIEPPQLGTMANSFALSTVSRHLVVSVVTPEELQTHFREIAPLFGHKEKELDLHRDHWIFESPMEINGKKMLDIMTRLEKIIPERISPDGKKTLIRIEVERSLRWKKGKIYVKTEDNPMSLKLKRTEEELAKLERDGQIAPLGESRVGRSGQSLDDRGIKEMANPIALRRIGGGPLVQKNGHTFYTAKPEEVMVTLISSSTPGSPGLSLIKGGKYSAETFRGAGKRELLEESGLEGAIIWERHAIDMKEIGKETKVEEVKSVWSSFVVDVGEGSGRSYKVFPEDSRFVVEFSLADAILILENAKDGGQSAQVLKDVERNVLGRDLTEPEVNLFKEYNQNVRSETVDEGKAREAKMAKMAK